METDSITLGGYGFHGRGAQALRNARKEEQDMDGSGGLWGGSGQARQWGGINNRGSENILVTNLMGEIFS